MQALQEKIQIYADYKKKYKDRVFINKMSMANRIEMLRISYGFLLDIFDNAYKTPDKKKTERWVTKELIDFLMPESEKLVKRTKGKQFENAYSVWLKSFALTARRSYHHFLLYMEQDRSEERVVYRSRIEVLRPIAYYMQLMLDTDSFKYLSISLPPNFGKSFLVNYFTGLVYGNEINSSVLRFSASESNIKTASGLIKGLLTEDRFKEIFPQFDIPDRDLFEISAWDGWKIKGADVEASHISITMGGGIPGKRANRLIILDDVTNGRKEARNEELFKAQWETYLADIKPRADGAGVKELIVGTMWNPNDIIGRKIEYETIGRDVVDGRFKYCQEIYKDGQLVGVIIQIPQLDYETDETTCARVMTTEEAHKTRAGFSDEFLWASAYMQRPVPQEGRPFAGNRLLRYDKSVYLGKEIITLDGKIIPMSAKDHYSQAVIDPVRKGTDFMAMPIFKKDEETGLHFLIDVIFKGRSMDEIYDDVVEKILLHNINKIVIVCVCDRNTCRRDCVNVYA